MDYAVVMDVSAGEDGSAGGAAKRVGDEHVSERHARLGHEGFDAFELSDRA